jgi:phage protein U
MLFQIGPLTLDTIPFAAESFGRSAGADLAVKPVMGGLQPREFMGEADESITISGQLLPTRLGGMTELELAYSLSTSGTKVPLMRGDGRMLGWYAIEKVSEQHSDLTRFGVGFVVKYTLTLTKVSTDGAVGSSQAGGLVGMLLNLFEAL